MDDMELQSFALGFEYNLPLQSDGKTRKPAHLHHMPAHHQCVLLGDKVGQVDERRSVLRLTREHQNLGAVVLHMFVYINQLVDGS